MRKNVILHHICAMWEPEIYAHFGELRALRTTLVEDAQPTGAGALAVPRDADGGRPRRAPVFLLRNIRRYQGLAVRQSLPTVSPSFLSTHVVEGPPARPRSPHKGDG